MLSLTDEENTDWSAPLGRPRAVRIVYVLPTRRGQGLPDQERLRVNVPPNYRTLHWRSPHIHGVEFAELDSYDIRGLSAMIYRKIHHHRIHYIIGATSDGRAKLRTSPNDPLTLVESIFIYNDEDVRTWLLSNSVLDDPLDLMVYCYRDRNDKRQNTAEPRVLPYLGEDAVRNWARDLAARIGQVHFLALQPDARPDNGQANNGQANEAEEAFEDDRSHFSDSPSDAADAVDGRDDLSGIFPSPVGERAESPTNRFPLAVTSSRLLNRQLPLHLLHRSGQVDKERKRSAQFDSENCEDETPKRVRLSSIAKEFSRAEEGRKRGAQFDDETGEEPKVKRLREDSVIIEGLKCDGRVSSEGRLFPRSN